MKKLILYSFLALLSALLLSCSVTRRMENRKPLQVTPDPQQLAVNQQVDPNTVNVNYMVQIPARYVPRKAQVIHQSYLVDGNQSQPITKIYINGRTYERLMWRQSRFEDQPADYSDGIKVVSGREPLSVATDVTVLFQEWMPDANLETTTSINLCGMSYPLSKQILARGVKYVPPKPVIIPPAPVAEEKPTFRKEEGFASLNYAVNIYQVNPNYGNNAAQLNKMAALLNKTLTDSLLTTDRIVITGICSPDGSYNYNQDLARNRAGAVKNYLVSKLKVNPELIHVDYIAEDWDGLRELVMKSNLANKSAILSIIDSTLGPDAKENALKQLPQYPIIKSQMFPKLRRVQYEIFYTEKVLPN